MIVLAGGGTGGHVFPLVALAEILSARGVAFAFVGTARGLEAQVVPARGFPLELLPVEPLKGRSIFGAVRGAAVAAAAVVRARALVTRLRARLIVSIGGYAAGPVALAGWASGVPIALLEPNRIAGFTQRLLGPLAKRIYVGFPESATSTKTRAFGIPLRAGFAPTAPRDRDRVRILVMGGSQGAAYLNDTLPEVLRSISEIEIVHQAGRGKIDGVRARYGASPAEVVEFLDDVPARLADADLVIARAGALTCAELAAVGRPAILVPFPFAADDHQWANAEALMRAGAAVAIRQSDASPERLRSEIVRLVTDRAARHAMADAARRRGVPGAANAIADDLLTLVEPAKGRFHVLGGAL